MHSCLAVLLMIGICSLVQSTLFHISCLQFPSNPILTLTFPFLIFLFDCHILPASFDVPAIIGCF